MSIPAPGIQQTDRLIFIEEFAKMIDRSPAAVRYMIHKGDGPRFAKIGGRRMARLSEVNVWINAQFDAEQVNE